VFEGQWSVHVAADTGSETAGRAPLTSEVEARVGDLANWGGGVALLVDAAAPEAEDGRRADDGGEDEEVLEDEDALLDEDRALGPGRGGAERREGEVERDEDREGLGAGRNVSIRSRI
jgi:hypothetical protein